MFFSFFFGRLASSRTIIFRFPKVHWGPLVVSKASELPGVHQVLQLLKSEIIVRAVQAPVGNRVQRTPRRIRFVFERMSLSNLVSVICSALPGVFRSSWLARNRPDFRGVSSSVVRHTSFFCRVYLYHETISMLVHYCCYGHVRQPRLNTQSLRERRTTVSSSFNIQPWRIVRTCKCHIVWHLGLWLDFCLRTPRSAGWRFTAKAEAGVWTVSSRFADLNRCETGRVKRQAFKQCRSEPCFLRYKVLFTMMHPNFDLLRHLSQSTWRIIILAFFKQVPLSNDFGVVSYCVAAWRRTAVWLSPNLE